MRSLTLSADEEKQNLEESATLANDYSDYEALAAQELELAKHKQSRHDYDDALLQKKYKRYSPDEADQFRRLLLALREWCDAGSRNVGWMKLEQRDRQALEKYTKRMRVTAERNGTLSIEFPTPSNEALYQFFRLLNNSQLALLGGPCGNRKKHKNRDFWFVRATPRRPLLFCSRQCAGDATKANERERERKRKIEKAQQAIDNFPKRPARFEKLTWQEYVTEAESSISKKFLTMAVRGGYLTPPKEFRPGVKDRERSS